MSRELIYEEALTCDLCGKTGAYDVYGDQICPTCMGQVSPVEKKPDCHDLVRIIEDLVAENCRIAIGKVAHQFSPANQEAFRILVERGILEHSDWDIYQWTSKARRRD